eukprot:COSAG02_NODE_2415_length_8913_cov_2.989676_3_plen_215_part_00
MHAGIVAGVENGTIFHVPCRFPGWEARLTASARNWRRRGWRRRRERRNWRWGRARRWCGRGRAGARVPPDDVVKASRLLCHGWVRMLRNWCALVADEVVDGIPSVGHRWVVVTPRNRQIEPTGVNRNSDLGVDIAQTTCTLRHARAFVPTCCCPLRCTAARRGNLICPRPSRIMEGETAVRQRREIERVGLVLMRRCRRVHAAERAGRVSGRDK